MSGQEVEQFDGASSGASNTYPQQCSALRKNGFVVIKEHPCKIVDMSTSKTGKHGHAKVKLTGLDIFNGKKYEDVCPSTHNMNVPHVLRNEYTVVDYEHEKEKGYTFIHLMNEDGEVREDLKLEEFTKPNTFEEFEKEYNDAGGSGNLLASVLKAMDTEGIVSFKKSS